METASILSHHHDLPINVEPGLAEVTNKQFKTDNVFRFFTFAMTRQVSGPMTA
jgi:hypothetical protein